MFKVLLVDDENRVLLSLEHGVNWEKSGVYIVGKANNAELALKLMQEVDPHIVFTDIRMPGMSGLDLIDHMRAINPNIQIVVISGYAEFAYAQRAIQQGVIGYCLKPFDDEEIEGLLQKATTALSKNQADHKAVESMITLLDTEISKNTAYETRNASLQQILKYIDNQYMTNITIQQLAQRFYLNSNYLSQLFRRELGLTFTEYVTQTRMQAAQKLLHTTTMSIREVSENIGFKDYFYFIRAFKKVTQQTPGQYRKEHPIRS